MLRLPDYYQRLKSMPGDPPGSAVMGTHSEQAQIFIIMFPVSSDTAMPYDHPEIVISGVHQALSDDQGLIEVESGTTKQGNRYIYSIVKSKNKEAGHGVQYTLTCNAEMPGQTVFLQGFFEETGMTGTRDSMIYALARNQNIVEDIFEGWFQDPYDPEYKKGLLMNLSEQKNYDRFFPAHPLSLARELMRFIAENN